MPLRAVTRREGRHRKMMRIRGQKGCHNALILLVILLLALALRFHRLGAQSLWNDEGTSVALAQRDLTTITRNASHDIHPPLYYYMLHCWVRLAGTSERGVRALSALGGVALVVVVYLLARPFGTISGFLAAFLAAISPFAIYYSQETRMYIFLALFGVLSMLAYEGLANALLGNREGKGETGAIILRAIGYILISALLVYTHYFGFALLFTQNVAFSVRWLWGTTRKGEQTIIRKRWPPLLYWGAVQCIVIAIYLPWLVMSWQALCGWPAVRAAFSLDYFASDVCRVLSLGVTVKGGLRTRLYAVGLCLLVLAGILHRPHGEKGRDIAPLHTDMALYLLLPLGLIFILSLRRPMYKQKFLLLVAPVYHILQARGILALGRLVRRAVTGWRWVEGVVAAFLSLAVCVASAHSLAGLYTDETFFRDDYRGAVAYIEATASSQDAIVINAPSQIETVDYYYHGDLSLYPLPKERPLDEVRTERALQGIVAQHRRIYGIFWATRESDPQGFVEGWLDGHCYKAMDSWFGNLRLLVYAVPREASGKLWERTDYILGEKVRLRGYTLLTPQPESGEIVQLSLLWEALAPLAERYKVFLHLVDERGNIVAQRDTEPVGGRRLTTDWEVGEVITDNHGILIPLGTPPGAHQLRVGLYNLADGVRLPVKGGDEKGDTIDLQEIAVQAPSLPPPSSALDMQHDIPMRAEARWGRLRLLGYSLYRLGHEHEGEADALHPDETATLIFFWTREAEGDTAPGEMILNLKKDDQILWERDLQITGERFPPEEWREEEKVRDIHRFPVPDIAPGTYDLMLHPKDGTSREEYRLTRLTIAANDH